MVTHAFLLLAGVAMGMVAAEIHSQMQAMMYLQRFGYMNKSNVTRAAMITPDAMSDYIRDFQRFAGVNVTGELDNTTMTMMNMPRCGVKDRVGHGDAARRRRRYALQGSKWRVTDLTYRISKYPSRIKERAKVDKEFQKAFKLWSDVTPLNFVAKKTGSVHIDIRFERGEHGDGDPFDGPSQTLAHAFFPQYGGDVHFDDEEKWSIDSYYGTNIFLVAAHEIGHSLGLSHSDIRRSLMAPFYQGYNANFKLDTDDVQGIQALYGKRSSPPPDTPNTVNTPERPPSNGDAPDLCQDAKIDAVTRIANGKTYVFKGDYYWEILSDGIAKNYPRKISEDWNGLPGNLDAALTWADGKTFFFKGSKYWRFHNQQMSGQYPKDIKVGFQGIPDNIEAALVWSGNGKTYFFKGDKFWRFDSRSDNPVSDKYPKPISNWQGIPNDIDAAFQWENGKTFFFKGRNYYRFNDREFAVEKGAKPPYPRSTSVWWFDCRSMSGRIPSHSGVSQWNRTSIRVDEDLDDLTRDADGRDDFDSGMHQPEKPLGQVAKSSSWTLTTQLGCLFQTILLVLLLRTA